MINSSRKQLITAIFVLLLIFCAWWIFKPNTSTSWSTEEINILQSLWIGNLPNSEIESSNAFVNNRQAAKFGQQLFFDTRLSANGQVSCATCHQPTRMFTDGLKLAEGADTGTHNTISIVGAAYSPWLFWDGRKDSLWSQALSPLETVHEHAGSRMSFVHLVSNDKLYRQSYEKLFGALPDFTNLKRFPKQAAPSENKELNQAWLSMMADDQELVNKVFINIGKAIAAYERLLVPGESRFDKYVEDLVGNAIEGQTQLNQQEIAGLKLFIGKAQCINCHNGPLFTNNEFHNTGLLPSAGELPSMGRANGVRHLLEDSFNCLRSSNNLDKNACGELRFVRLGDELIGSHKVPSLRNVFETAPYMHAGQFNSLKEVIEHYDQAPSAIIGHNEVKPLNLSNKEKKQLELFLLSLSSPLATDAIWLKNPHI